MHNFIHGPTFISRWKPKIARYKHSNRRFTICTIRINGGRDANWNKPQISQSHVSGRWSEKETYPYLYSCKRQALCCVISGRKVGKPKVTPVRLRDEPFRIFSPIYGIVWETEYGRFITLKIPKYEHFKRKNDRLTLPLYVRCSFWWPWSLPFCALFAIRAIPH